MNWSMFLSTQEGEENARRRVLDLKTRPETEEADMVYVCVYACVSVWVLKKEEEKEEEEEEEEEGEKLDGECLTRRPAASFKRKKRAAPAYKFCSTLSIRSEKADKDEDGQDNECQTGRKKHRKLQQHLGIRLGKLADYRLKYYCPKPAKRVLWKALRQLFRRLGAHRNQKSRLSWWGTSLALAESGQTCRGPSSTALKRSYPE